MNKKRIYETNPVIQHRRDELVSNLKNKFPGPKQIASQGSSLQLIFLPKPSYRCYDLNSLCNFSLDTQNAIFIHFTRLANIF